MRISDWSSDVCSSDLASKPVGSRSHPYTRAPCSRKPSAIAPPKAEPTPLTAIVRPARSGSEGIGELREMDVVLDRRAALDRSEEHTSELQSLMRISYAVSCLTKKTSTTTTTQRPTR